MNQSVFNIIMECQKFFFNLVFERCSNRVASFRNDFFGAYWSYSLLGHIGHVHIALGLGPFHRQIPEVDK